MFTTIITSLLGGSLIGVLLTYTINSRKQNLSEFDALVDKYQALNKQLEEKLKELDEEVNKLRKLEIECKNEINKLKNQLILLESSNNDLPLPVWVKDINLQMLYANNLYEKMFLAPMGKTIDDYIGNDDFAIWPKEEAAAFRENDRKIIENKQPIQTIETVSTGEGEKLELSVLKYPRMLNNTVIGVQGIVLQTKKIENK